MAKHFSTFAIAEMLQVDPGSVANWIDQDMLRAYRTPGGHRRVSADDLLAFLREHKMPIPPALGATGSRVLIVDDEPGVTQMIARVLRTKLPSCEVAEAHDGFVAGTLVATLRPDLVILDLRMPGMDGYEVCALIKGREDTRHAEVLAMTAYPSPDSEKAILARGARACLTKPLDMDLLLREVQASLCNKPIRPRD